jgi:hypothetical protein
MKNKTFLFASAVFLILSLGFFVQAAGIAAPYWKDNSLLLSPGEKNTVILYLQNTGEESMTVEAIISSDGDIASLKETIYEIGAGEIDVPVEVEVVVPENAQRGSDYKVSLSFNQIAAGEGMVFVASAFSTSFPVQIVSPEESVLYGINPPSNFSYWLIILIIFGLVVLGFVWVKISKKKKTSKKFK